jgi:hypothetical protein
MSGETGEEPDPDPGETGNDEAETGNDETDTGESDTGELPKLDTAPPDGESMGCNVDFLFVIDNSVSMGDNQAALLSSFPGFMDTIQDTLAANDDYHIMVVDTDADTRCSPSGCANPDSWALDLCFGAENGDACDVELDECDVTMGAGVVHPVGASATNELCEIAGDNRYLTGEEDDLGEAFACIAQVGEAGWKEERPMDAMVAAVAEDINGPGGCNDGFLREDAILVVTFISDDPNYEDTGNPATWKQALLDAKGGDEDSIVVLGLVPNPPDCANGSGGGFTCMNGMCVPNGDKEQGEHWREFVESFGEQGLWAEVCEDSYTPFFDSAVDLIDLSCDLNPAE